MRTGSGSAKPMGVHIVEGVIRNLTDCSGCYNSDGAPPNLKRGNIYYIQWTGTGSKNESEMLVSFIRKEYERMGHKRQSIFSVLASLNIIMPEWEVSPYWAAAIYKKVDVKDLPLYLYFNYKSPEFMKLLKGV